MIAPMIARIDLAAIDELREALPRFTHKPLPHLSYLKRDQIEGYWLDDIARELADESSTAFVSRGADAINGLVLYSDSPWDTKVIGKPVAFIKYIVGTGGTQDWRTLDELLDQVLQHAGGRGIQCLMCKVQPLQFPSIHALERHGFLLMDTIVIFSLTLRARRLTESARPNRSTDCMCVWRIRRTCLNSLRSLKKPSRIILADTTQTPNSPLKPAVRCIRNGSALPLAARRIGF